MRATDFACYSLGRAKGDTIERNGYPKKQESDLCGCA